MDLSQTDVNLLSTLVTPLVLAVAAWVANKIVDVMRDKLHMDLDAADVKAIHDAADTAAGGLLAQVAQGKISLNDIHAGHEAVIAASANARQAVPDAADNMSVEVADMVRMVLGRVGHALASQPKDPPHA